MQMELKQEIMLTTTPLRNSSANSTMAFGREMRSILIRHTFMYLEYEMSQFTDGKCLRCASFLSKPQNT